MPPMIAFGHGAGNTPEEPIKGLDWNKEVVDRSFKRETVRNEFYEKLAKLRLKVETSPDGILDDPTKSGLKTFDELKRAQDFSTELNPKEEKFEEGKGWTLHEILDNYFKTVGVTDDKVRAREIGLSLYYLTRQKDKKDRSVNVDYLNAKWKVEIKGGQISIFNAKGEPTVEGAYLRKPAAQNPYPPGTIVDDWEHYERLKDPNEPLHRPDASGDDVKPPKPPEVWYSPQQQNTPAILSQSANTFVDRAKERVKNKESLEKAFETVHEALTVGKSKLDALIANGSAEEIAKSTNAWSAWGPEGILKGDEHKPLRIKLQKILNEGGADAAANRYARQLWRTEMVTYALAKLSASNRTDKENTVKEIMAAQLVTSLENDPMEALTGAMHLDTKIHDRNVRQALAAEMAASTVNGGIADIPPLFKFRQVKEVKVVTGGDFVSVPLAIAGELKFKHLVMKESESRIYGQMENGCKGNLVIIELLPPGAGGGDTLPPKPGTGGAGGGDTLPPKPGTGGAGGGDTLPPKPGTGGAGGGDTLPPRSGAAGGAELPAQPGAEGGAELHAKPGAGAGDTLQLRPGAAGGAELPSQPGAQGGAELPSKPGAQGGAELPTQPGSEGGDTLKPRPGAAGGAELPSQPGAQGGAELPAQPGAQGGAELPGKPDDRFILFPPPIPTPEPEKKDE